MRFTRRRSDRSGSVRRKHVSYTGGPGEPAIVLSSAIPATYALICPATCSVANPITHREAPVISRLRPTNPNSPGLTNSGKIVRGTDREGD